jgi:hypothetical protein
MDRSANYNLLVDVETYTLNTFYCWYMCRASYDILL